MQVRLKDLKPPTCVVRRFDELEQELLRDSIAEHGLLTPLVICDNQIVDGYRRSIILIGEGEEFVEASVVDGDPDVLRVVAQTCATETTKTDRKMIVATYLERYPSATAAEIGHIFKWSPIEVEKVVCVDALCPEARQRYEAGEIDLYTVWFLARVLDKAQLDLMEGPIETLRERSEAHLREVKHDRRRSMSRRIKVKSYKAVTDELQKPIFAAEELIACDAKTPLDGWLAALRWVSSSK